MNQTVVNYNSTTGDDPVFLTSVVKNRSKKKLNNQNYLNDSMNSLPSANHEDDSKLKILPDLV